MSPSEFPQENEEQKMSPEEKRSKISEAIEEIEDELSRLEKDGTRRFACSWEGINRSLRNLYDIAKDDNNLLAILQKSEHKESNNLWNTLNRRIYENNMNSSVVSPGELADAVKRYRALIADLKNTLG